MGSLYVPEFWEAIKTRGKKIIKKKTVIKTYICIISSCPRIPKNIFKIIWETLAWNM